MTTAAQDTVTLVKTLYDLTNNHQSDSAWLDKSLAFFAEDCEVIDVPAGMTSRGPDGYKQLILFFEEGFPGSSIDITNLFASEVWRSLSLLAGEPTLVLCTCRLEIFRQQIGHSSSISTMSTK